MAVCDLKSIMSLLTRFEDGKFELVRTKLQDGAWILTNDIFETIRIIGNKKR